ncbi:hypothetical protein RM844_06795 [Streptomyces sp. DSM 44915]|uniref:Uncharacterized protein n=1 Tax=Streptomyces chisholmiae TaxID=3075540 RepID=A0ABU2JNB7_9ACTN|nr:hypothetical protein [Streptomyces sp. DSM 44915]MDT0265999.1 hypothetical protein [Streptomyces sp. DSM 44915]
MRYDETDIDALLGDSAAPPPHVTAESAAEEAAESRRRIERDIADALWREALERDEFAIQALALAPASRPPGPRPPAILQDRAGRDLAELSRLIIRTSHAATDIAGLVDRIEPDGAMVFACLLHLSRRHDGARFWWQFSAGAGKSTAALCLYLLHLQQGDMRDAQHWAEEAAALDDQEHRRGAPRRTFYVWEEPVLYRRGTPTIESMLLRIVAALGQRDQPRHSTINPRLNVAIRGLETDHHPLFGDIPRADLTLVEQLEATA